VPEGLEAELYRRAAARCVGRRVERAEVDGRQPMAAELTSALPGLTFVAARRIGKLVLLDTEQVGGRRRRAGPTLGLHFGMTGRLVVDGVAPIDRLEYGSGRDNPAWDRFAVAFRGGGALRVNDPRRWATFTLDPDESRLGPDFLAVGRDRLGAALAGRRAALKAVLLDQTVVAGFGNLCVDEILWQAGLAPARPAGSLAPAEVGALHRAMGVHLPAMLARGGSHRGTIDPEVRASMPPCPRDGAALRRDRVGGRTTVWCPVHQAAEPGR
jgi:formamidopyrimidine-DNA glycosylase